MPAVGSILEVSPAVWNPANTLGDYPIQRRFQWYKDGVAIPGATGAAHTAETAGSYTVSETAFFLYNNAGGFGEGASTTSTSAPITITGTVSAGLVYQQHLSWIGSFRPPDRYIPGDDSQDFSYGLGSLAFNPAGNGGAGSLFGTGHYNNEKIGEFSIPTPSTTTPPFATLLNTANLIDPSEGQIGISGITGGTNVGLAVFGSRLLISCHGTYTYSNASFIWDRPLDLTVTGQVRGPFYVTDQAYNDNGRCYAGHMVNVPADMQSKVGSLMLCGVAAQSIVSATTDGPAYSAFNPSNFSTSPSSLRGTLASVTTNSFVVTGGSSTDGAYVGWVLGVNDNIQFGIVITGYVGATKRATISGWTSGQPANGVSYVLCPRISADALVMYADAQLQTSSPYGNYPGIWSWTASPSGHAAFPNGTRSILMIGSGGNGMMQYAIGSGGDYNNGEVSAEGYRCYDPTDGSRGEHQYPYKTRVWAYDANELEQVRLGNLTPNSIKPYAVWNFDLPNIAGSGQISCRGVAYDPANRRLFVAATTNYGFGQRIIHVYQVTNAVAA